jgi:hypothetical protein
VAASPYPAALTVRVEHLEAEVRDLRAHTEVIPVLISENASLAAEIKWLRYTLIGFIPIVCSVVVAVLRATGSAG